MVVAEKEEGGESFSHAWSGGEKNRTEEKKTGRGVSDNVDEETWQWERSVVVNWVGEPSGQEV